MRFLIKNKLLLLFALLIGISCSCNEKRFDNNKMSWIIGDTTAPNGILPYFYNYLSVPNSVDELIAFLEYTSSVDSLFEWTFHYSLDYYKTNYDCLTLQKIIFDNYTDVIIRNGNTVIAEESCNYKTIPILYLLKPVIINKSGDKVRVFDDSLKSFISDNLISFIKQRKRNLESKLTTHKKIRKEIIIFEYNNRMLFDLISGDTLDVINNTYYKNVFELFDEMAEKNQWKQISVLFWDLREQKPDL